MSGAWLAPFAVREYSEYADVKTRADAKLEIDIARAQQFIAHYTNATFDAETLPAPVQTACLLLADAYAHNACQQAQKQLLSETFDDYSYTATSALLDISALDIAPLLDPFILPAARGRLSFRFDLI